ncbi:MAG TPA: hypothetical protein VM695_12490 [Phycisphaerae bacterium]|nr:hypothetical protein [Phycisphaerae bacterium]
MAKKKNSVALFEVIQKARRTQANMDVPKWMDGDEAAAAQARLGPPVEARPAGSPEPIVSIAGDRLRLSLSYASCAIVAVGALVLLLGAFGLGWWGGSSRRGEATTRPAGPLKDRTPFGRHVLGKKDGLPGGGAPVSRPGGAAATAGARTSGKWYLVIQLVKDLTARDRQDADDIVAWLATRGEKATVAEYGEAQAGRRRYAVWSMRPFENSTGPENLEFARTIEELGQLYLRSGGRYNFQQRLRPGAEMTPQFMRAP